MDPKDTKERLLDAAERLFARGGYHGTSLRAITGEAGANLAAVNYHFGSKEALLSAVFRRRLDPLNAERLERLAGVEESARRQGARPAVIEILRAFAEPTFRFRDSQPGARHFVALVGRALVEPDPAVREIFVREMGSTLAAMEHLLAASLPQLDAKQRYWRLLLAVAVMGRLMGSSEGLPPSSEGGDLNLSNEERLELSVTFAAAGVVA